jgi:hypothetical protein
VQQISLSHVRPRARLAGLTGAVEGNSRLTAAAAALLLVLLAVEGATVPFIGQLLSVHVFVGMLLLGPVALKLGSTGYRMARYYTRSREYVEKGPPPTLMRVLVAPVLVASTLTLFGTGVALVAVGPGGALAVTGPPGGLLLGLHKASFIVWFGAMSIHVLAYARRAARDAFADWGRRRIAGAGLRLSLLLGALTAGVVVALLTLPLAAPWVQWATTGWGR